MSSTLLSLLILLMACTSPVRLRELPGSVESYYKSFPGYPGTSARSSKPCRLQPTSKSQLCARATGAAPSGKTAGTRQPSNQRAEDAGATAPASLRAGA